jgi:Mitochondrial 28S ribosomal protein S34
MLFAYSFAAYEVLSSLPKHGVGTKITRSTWQDNSFWTVTQIKTEMVRRLHIYQRKVAPACLSHLIFFL